ncbi:MAG TPA: UPF0147 family protein [Candidatus Nanoarchaeia archaeon]|nr:UPF0147 family protein [Candidatus Nanoarchaeia archaeon]
MNNNFEEVIARLEELREEFDSNKKLKEKMNSVISILRKNPDLVIEKALTELEELNSMNLPSYHRTQVWDVVSLLESLKN